MDDSGRITCSVKEAIELTGLGRTTIYALLDEQKITSVRVGTKRLIHVESLRRLLEPDGEPWVKNHDKARARWQFCKACGKSHRV